MFGHVVLTQAGISPKQQFYSGALGRVPQGDARTPSLAARAWGFSRDRPFAEGDLLC